MHCNLLACHAQNVHLHCIAAAGGGKRQACKTGGILLQKFLSRCLWSLPHIESPCFAGIRLVAGQKSAVGTHRNGFRHKSCRNRHRAYRLRCWIGGENAPLRPGIFAEQIPYTRIGEYSKMDFRQRGNLLRVPCFRSLKGIVSAHQRGVVGHGIVHIVQLAGTRGIKFGKIVAVETVGGYEVAAHVAVANVAVLAVSGPHVHFQTLGVIAGDGGLVEVSGLDVDIDTVLHAPVEMVGPVLAGQELEGDVGIVLSDIFQTGLHRSEDNHLVAHAGLFDFLDKQRNVALVVAVHTGGPLKLHHGAYTAFLAYLQILLHRAQTACVIHAVAALVQLFGLQLGESGRGNIQSAAQAGSVVVVGAHELKVLGELHIRFEVVVAEFDSFSERFLGILQPESAAAVPYKQWLGVNA